MKRLLSGVFAVLMTVCSACSSPAKGTEDADFILPGELPFEMNQPFLGEEGEIMDEVCSPLLEDQLFEMNYWLRDAREAAWAEDYELEASYLQRIAIYDQELFPDEVTWALAALGDLCAAGLYADENEDETGETPDKTPAEQAIAYYAQAMEVYEKNPALSLRKGYEYQDFLAETSMKLGDLYAAESQYEKAASCYDCTIRLSWDTQRHLEAQYRLALLCMDESTGIQELRLAKSYLINASSQGHEKAWQTLQDWLADDAYEWGMYYITISDYESAFRHLLPAAEQGDAACMIMLGYLYYGGLTGGKTAGGNRESQRDPEQACFWYAKAAEAGSPEAMEWLISYYVYSTINDHAPLIDEQTAVAWAMRAIDKGDADLRNNAMCDLGRLCQYRKEFEQAEAWYTQAEEWLWLGRMFRDEEEIRNYEKATAYLLKESENTQGAFFTTAAAELRDLYLDPDFGPIEYDRLAELYKLAYRKGFTGSLYSLALLYLEGQYGMQDTQQGMYWMHMAASRAEGLTRADYLSLTPQERKSIENAKAWFEARDREYAGTAN